MSGNGKKPEVVHIHKNLNELFKINLELKQIIGFEIRSGEKPTINIAMISKLKTLQKEIAIPLPKYNNKFANEKRKTQIKSIQKDPNDGPLLVEIIGELSPETKSVIECILKRMETDRMQTLLLPICILLKNNSTFYYSKDGGVENLEKIHDYNVKNIRFFGDFILFSCENTIRKFPIGSIDGVEWRYAVSNVYKFPEEVIFLGRVINNTIDVIFDKKTVSLNLTNEEKKDTFKHVISRSYLLNGTEILITPKEICLSPELKLKEEEITVSV